VLAPELDRLPKNSKETNPEMQTMAAITAKPVSPDKPAADVLINHNQAAYICGLGEMGLGGFFLTPEFGPMQRFAFILPDAELECDTPYSNERLCDDCGLCVKACPGNAISAETEKTKNWGGKSIKHQEVDTHQCSAYLSGADIKTNPFIPDDIIKEHPELKELLNPKHRLTPSETAKVKELTLSYYGGVGGGYGPSMCGMACKRECMIHLQEKGVLRKRFVNPFRTEPAWYK
jgi:NAD-dependent dihydropyrimidine dehydrogenase PreA subunit